MKKVIVLFAACALLSACWERTLTSEAPFVSDVVMPGGRFDAGDEVTVRAAGFVTDDDIMIRRVDPATQLPTVQRAEIVGRSSGSISFIMPSGYPAGEVEVLLFRSGEFMVLGSIAVSDGLPPVSASLYGMGRNASGHFVINEIDVSAGGLSTVAVVDHAMDGAVTWAGTNRVFGMERSDAGTTASGYDLTMRRRIAIECDDDLSGCIIGMWAPSPVLMSMDDERRMKIADYRMATRNIGQSVYYFTAVNIPEDVRTVRFKGDPFVYISDGCVAAELIVGTGDGTDRLALAIINISARRWRLAFYLDGADDVFPVSFGKEVYMVMVSGDWTVIRDFSSYDGPAPDGERPVVGEVPYRTLSCTPDAENGRLFMLVVRDGAREVVGFSLADGVCEELCAVPAEVEQILMVR